MNAVLDDESYSTHYVQSGDEAERFRAKDLMREIAQAAWECGDPGMQYDTTINKWHTCPVYGRINASNPCSEYMHVDDSSSNLASINVLQYLVDDGTFNVKDFIHTVDVIILAQEIVVDFSSYPTAMIENNTHALRQRMGYANIVCLHLGIPYDSRKRGIPQRQLLLLCVAEHTAIPVSSRNGLGHTLPLKKTASQPLMSLVCIVKL